MKSELTKRRGEGVTPPPDLVDAVKALVAAEGEDGAAKKLGIGASTVTRLRFGGTCRPGTIELARMRLGLRS